MWYMNHGNNPGPTFNNGEVGMMSTMVLTVGITFVSVVIPCGSMVLIIGIALASVVSPCGSMVLTVGITLAGAVSPYRS